MNDPGYAYPETSGSALLAFAMARGARRGWLDPLYAELAAETFTSVSGLLKRKGHTLSLPQISGDTMPWKKLGYKLIPKRSDAGYGSGAYLLLAREMELIRLGRTLQ